MARKFNFEPNEAPGIPKSAEIKPLKSILPWAREHELAGEPPAEKPWIEFHDEFVAEDPNTRRTMLRLAGFTFTDESWEAFVKKHYKPIELDGE